MARVLESPADLEWQAGQVCAQTDPDLWFPEPGQSPLQAQLICWSCRARQVCLDYALANNETGVWGGTTETERNEIRREARAA